MITVSFIIQLISASFIGCAKDSRGEVDKLQLSVTNMFTSVSKSLSINCWVAHRVYWFFSENILKRKCKHQHDFRVSDHGSCGEVGALRLPITSLHAEYRSPPEEAEGPLSSGGHSCVHLVSRCKENYLYEDRWATVHEEPSLWKSYPTAEVSSKPSPGTRGAKRPFSLLRRPDTGPSLPP